MTVVENKLAGNLLTGNVAADGGGGLSLTEFVFDLIVIEPSQGTIDNNIFERNTADDGAAIDVRGTRAKIYNNTIHNTTARDSGGGVYFGIPLDLSDVADFVNNLVTSNQAMGTVGLRAVGFTSNSRPSPSCAFAICGGTHRPTWAAPRPTRVTSGSTG